MRRVAFDMDVLRSFALGVELGNFAKAADRLGRSTSAVSAQLRKLEEQAGTEIFRKSGRGLVLTEAGETMLAYARRLLDLNDEAAVALQSVKLEGWVRIGLQQDFGEVLLPRVLAGFSRAYPKVRIEAKVARNADLLHNLEAGRLDLALAWDDGHDLPNKQQIAQLPMRWIGPSDQVGWQHAASEPLPLVALDNICRFRAAGTAALDAAGIAWRIAFTSPNLGGVWAATAAGLGLTVRTAMTVPSGMRVFADGEYGLPELPLLTLAMYRKDTRPDPAVVQLETILMERLREDLPL